MLQNDERNKAEGLIYDGKEFTVDKFEEHYRENLFMCLLSVNIDLMHEDDDGSIVNAVARKFFSPFSRFSQLPPGMKRGVV